MTPSLPPQPSALSNFFKNPFFKQKPLAVMLILAMTAPLALTACGKKEGAAGAGGAAQQMPPTVVNVMPVQFQTIPLVTELAGRTVAFQEATVTPQVTGVIEQQLFREGSVVRQGQPLYKINADNYTSTAASAAADLEKARAAEGSAQANVANAAANLKSAEVQYNLANVKLKRLASLIASDAVSKQEYEVQAADLATKAASVESARSNLQVARAAVASAAANVKGVQAMIRASQLNLSRTTITAPMSGVASRPLVNVGALVTAGQTQIMTISRLDPIYVDISQSAAELLALRQQMMKGQVGQAHSAEVRLKLSDGSLYPVAGQLSFEEAKVDPATGAINLRAIFRNPNYMLLPGMFVNAQVIQGVINNGVLLPQSAINRTAKGETTVNIVDANNKIQVRPVTVQGTYQGKWIITSGLQQGENVVIIGGSRAKPDQDVVVKPYVASEDTTNKPNPAPTNPAVNSPANSSTTTTTTQQTVVANSNNTASPASGTTSGAMPITNSIGSSSTAGNTAVAKP